MNSVPAYSNYMIRHRFFAILTHPATKSIYWVLFAILFYNSGQGFTIWLLEPEGFEGGLEWIQVALFPLLLPAFFLSSRYLGCSSQCSDRGKIKHHAVDSAQQRMPG